MIKNFNISHMGKCHSYYIINCEVSFLTYEREEIEVLLFDDLTIGIVNKYIDYEKNTVLINETVEIKGYQHHQFLNELRKETLNHPKVRLRRLFI